MSENLFVREGVGTNFSLHALEVRYAWYGAIKKHSYYYFLWSLSACEKYVTFTLFINVFLRKSTVKSHVWALVILLVWILSKGEGYTRVLKTFSFMKSAKYRDTTYENNALEIVCISLTQTINRFLSKIQQIITL